MKPFKDPIQFTSRKGSYNYIAPTKDQATTGRFSPAGDDYGVGHRQPVGSEKHSSKGPIPTKCKVFSADEI